jgi:hypothetical protein
VGERFIGNSDFAEIDKTPSRSGFAGIGMQIERGNGQNRRFSARCAIPRLESLPAKPQKRSGLPRARTRSAAEKLHRSAVYFLGADKESARSP